MRLPGLPMKFWGQLTILAVAAKARMPLYIDKFMDHRRKIGYAQVCVELDATKPLTPGVLIQGKNERFWQPFVFENLPIICYQYGRIGHVGDVSHFSGGDLSGGKDQTHISVNNVVAVDGEVFPDGLPPSSSKGSSAAGGVDRDSAPR